MRSLSECIEKLQKGDNQATLEILEKMEPLAKRYARKIHFQEYEDSLQEMKLALLEAIPHLNTSRSEAENLKYLQVSVEHKYFYLCKKWLPRQEMEMGKEEVEIFEKADRAGAISEIENKLDLEKYIRFLYRENPKQAMILYWALYEQWTDKKIAEKLQTSRQYINRIKRKHLKKILENRLL